jgi:Spy/CpxP family protein refolding chaperone
MNGDHTMRTWMRIALVLVAALGLAGAADARPDEHRPIGGLIARNAERLGLEGEALAAVQAVVTASGQRHEALVAELDAARQAMRALLSKPVPDSAAVMAQADAIGAIETRLHKNRLQAIMEIRALLTPAQREELLRVRDEEHAKRELEGKECGPHGDLPPGPPR